MGARADDAATRSERARAIGLFRYQLIREAADPAHSTRARGRLVRAVAAVEHTDPTGRRVRVSRDTLDRWIRAWRRGGFDALVPSPRQSAPRLPVEVVEMAVALKRENPGCSTLIWIWPTFRDRAGPGVSPDGVTASW